MRKAGGILLIVIGLFYTCECVCAEQAQKETVVQKQQATESQLPKDTNQVVMIFDGKELTLKQIEFLSPSLDYAMVENIADFWLDTQLLYEEAVKKGIDKDEKAKFLADMNYKKTIASGPMEKVRNDVKVTDENVRKYYEENKETDLSLQDPMYLSFSHITLNSLEEAEAVLKKINDGGDINQLAREQSTASDAQKGGKANKFQRNTVKTRFGDDFLNALLNATEGQIIGPVKNKDGKYEIARHEGKRAPKTKDFEKVKQTIRANLENQARKKAMEDLLNGLRENAKQRYKMALVPAEKHNNQKNEKNSEQKDN
jgi:peptidyl-prolyl cis-trans isomerase C